MNAASWIRGCFYSITVLGVAGSLEACGTRQTPPPPTQPQTPPLCFIERRQRVVTPGAASSSGSGPSAQVNGPTATGPEVAPPSVGSGGVQMPTVTAPQVQGPTVSTSSGTAARDGGPAMIVRTLRWEDAARLLLRNFTQTDTTHGRVDGAFEDCTGTTIRWPETDENCIEHRAEPEALPRTDITEDDVTIVRAANGMRLVWVVAQRFSNGEGLGPVALVDFTERGIAVRAIGSLRGMPRRARLRIERMDPERILVAEGERCADPEDATTCQRSMRLLTVRNNRFEAAPLVFEDNTCIGPAYFQAMRDEIAPLSGTGWNRRYELTSSLAFNTGNITIHEQIVVADYDPGQPNIPRRVFRRVDADRNITVVDGRLVTNAVSLWSRVVDHNASTQGRIDQR